MGRRAGQRRTGPLRTCFDEVDQALGQNLFRLMREGPRGRTQADREMRSAGDQWAHSLARGSARLTEDGGGRVGQGGKLRRGPTALANIRLWCAAGSFRFWATTAKLLKLRGQAMQAAVPVGVGAMAALLGADPRAGRRKIADVAAQGEVCTGRQPTMTRRRSSFRATRAAIRPRDRICERRWAPSAPVSAAGVGGPVSIAR